MIIDTSAIISIFFKESGFEKIYKKLAKASTIAIGTPTLAETAIVLVARLDKNGRDLLQRFLYKFNVTEIPFGDTHWKEAVEAYINFGKGRHPASLNFGDCMTYATAKLAGQPLLCTGDDFKKTDLKLA